MQIETIAFYVFIRVVTLVIPIAAMLVLNEVVPLPVPTAPARRVPTPSINIPDKI
mgnify:CR=1 FL=1